MFNKNLSKTVATPAMCRPRLQNVYFNAESSEYVATNGHVLMIERTIDKPSDTSTFLNSITGQVIEEEEDPKYVDYKHWCVFSGESLDWSEQPCNVYKFSGKKRNGYFPLKVVEIGGVFFNFDYLKTIVDFFEGESVAVTVGGRKEGYNWRCYQFLNADGGKRALLMPIQLTESDLSSNYTFVKPLPNFEQLRGRQKQDTVVYVVSASAPIATFKTRTKADKFAAAYKSPVDVTPCALYD